MEKRIKIAQQEVDYPLVEFFSDSAGFEKTASGDFYSQAIRQYLEQLEQENNKLYALVNALTAGEYFGSNKNGDYFPEQALAKYHNTFVDGGHVFTHHQNKDPKKAIGEILFSTFNDKMRRVELVISLDSKNDRVQRIIRELGEGRMPATSMGCRVPYDICSICGHKAKTTSHYCNHLKTKMNKILPDGRRIYAINTKPRFFDISIVTIPADPTSRFMGVFGLDRIKTANKKAERTSQAEIEKEVDSKITHLVDDPKELILKTQKDLTPEQIEKLSQYPFDETLSTFLALRVLPKRHEFQKLALYSLGKKKLADELEKQDYVFSANPNEFEIPQDVYLDKANEKIAGILEGDLHNISLVKPFILARVLEKTSQIASNNTIEVFGEGESDPRSYIKRFLFDPPDEPANKSPVKNPVGPMVALGTLYAGYAKLFGDTSKSKFTKFIQKSPWLAPLLAGGVAFGTSALQARALEKQAGVVERFLGSALVATPVSYYGSAVAESKAQLGMPISNTEDFVRKHPLLTSFLGAVGATSLQGSLIKNYEKAKNKIPKFAELTCNMKPEHINQLYSDLFE